MIDSRRLPSWMSLWIAIPQRKLAAPHILLRNQLPITYEISVIHDFIVYPEFWRSWWQFLLEMISSAVSNHMIEQTNTELARVAPVWDLQMWGVIPIWSGTIQERVALHCGPRILGPGCCVFTCVCQDNLVLFSAYLIHFKDPWSPFMNLDEKKRSFCLFEEFSLWWFVVLMIYRAVCDDSGSGKRWMQDFSSWMHYTFCKQMQNFASYRT